MKVNDIYEVTNDNYCLTGRHRILWVNKAEDLVVTIAVPDFLNGKLPYYFAGPKARSLLALQAAISSGDLRPTSVRLRGVFAMTDKKIAERYPGTGDKLSAPLRARDESFKVIEPALTALKDDRQEFFEDNGLREAVLKAERANGDGKNKIYNYLHRYLSLGIGKNALLPFRDRCGAPGKERKSKNSLGNTSEAFKAGLTSHKNYVWQDGDKEKLALCWSLFLDGKNSVEDAYELAMGVYWSDGTRIRNGEELPVLLPASQRPSLAQFRRWGSAGEGNKDAWELMLGYREWESNYRGLYGSEFDGINAVGQIARSDSTSCDNQLVTQTSRLLPIGSAKRLTILEGLTGVIPGIHVGLDAPSEEIALLAVLNAATSNVAMARDYGVELDEDDMPPIFFAKYLVDNGEFRTGRTIDVLTGLGSGLDLTPSYRGDPKGSGESVHHSLQKSLDHKITGTTKGRQRKRGEPKPALLACWTFPEYMRLLLIAVRYHNCEQRVEAFMNRHPYCSRMKRAGVPPIRKAIYQWCVSEGLIASPSYDTNVLRAALLPTMRAVVHHNGVFLLRHDRGDRKDIVASHRFVGPIVEANDWLAKARRTDTFEIDVHVHPNHLKSIWYADRHGLHELINASNDLAFVRTGTLHDSLALQNEDTIDRRLSRDETDQAKADVVIARTVQDDANRRQKQAEIAALPKKPTKKQLTSDVRANRETEREALAGATARELPIDSTDSSAPRLAVEQSDGAETRTPDWLDQILEEHRNE